MRIGHAGMHCRERPKTIRSADGVPYHREESDCEQHGRNKRCECDGDHDAALPTATNIARLSLCHVRPALRERFSVLAPMRTRHIPLRS
jgi:hypothetical protein